MKPLPLALAASSAAAVIALSVLLVRSHLQQRELRSHLSQLEPRLAETEAALATASARGTQLDQRLAVLARELAEARAQHQAAAGRGTALAAELEEARAELGRREDAAAQLQRELAAARQDLLQQHLDYAATPEDVQGYRDTIAQLTERVQTLEVQAPVAPETSAGRAVAVQGFVVGVGPQNAFIVFDLGLQHGIRRGQRAQVQREETELAQVEISDVHEKHSIAQVLPASLQGSPHPGDLVILLP